MVWLPAARADIESTAFPLLRVAVPRTVAPSRNCTVPVAPEGDTVAVKVTGWPYPDGFADDANVAVAAALTTVCTHAGDVLAMYPPSPPNAAVMECVPTASSGTLSCAAPALIVAVPSEVAPSKNCTVPVAPAGVTVAVNCTARSEER